MVHSTHLEGKTVSERPFFALPSLYLRGCRQKRRLDAWGSGAGAGGGEGRAEPGLDHLGGGDAQWRERRHQPPQPAPVSQHCWLLLSTEDDGNLKAVETLQYLWSV